MHFVRQSWFQIITYNTPFTNNHILNTLLMKWSAAIFGISEISLRLPNILAFLLYLYFGFRILQRNTPNLFFPAFILLTLNPYLLDFFGLARGYGLSIAFMTMGFHYLLLFFEKPRSSYLVWMNLGAFLAILANFTMLYFYGSILILFNLVLLSDSSYTRSIQRVFKLNVVNLISVFMTVLIVFGPLKKIVTQVPIDFGGKTGLIHDTIRSMVIMSYFGINDFWTGLITWGLVLVVLLIFIYMFYRYFNDHSKLLATHRSLFIINGLILLIFLMIISNHHILGVDFPIQRFALFLFPILVWNVAFGLEILFKYRPKLVVFGGSVLVVLTVWNFTRQVNSNYYRDWAYDADTRMAMQSLVRDYNVRSDTNSPVQVGVSWVFEPTMNFYRIKMDLDWMAPVNRSTPCIEDHYIYVLRNEYPLLEKKGGEIIFSPEQADAVLIRMHTRVDSSNSLQSP